MQRFKLANVLLDVEDFLATSPEAVYRLEEGSSCSYDAGRDELEVRGLVDFATYFNGVPVRKWRRYADVRRILLHIEVSGPGCVIAARSLSASGPGARAMSEVPSVTEVGPASGFAAYDLEMPDQAVIAGFSVMADQPERIRNVYYFTEVDEARIRPVRLALCTTTFCKEEFVIPNIERIKAGVLGCGDPIADNFHMFVVDNGRTLDAQALSDEDVTVIPNPNVGGAGGFARGMIAAQDSPVGFTHVILMDDDVRMSVESFKRTFSLLSLVTDEYALACLNGAMLELERPWVHYEDVAYVRKVGGYSRIKLNLDITSQDDIVHNEMVDVESVFNARTYGAWWYSCIPVALIEEHGLPMPFFVRCDDVEYGARLNAKYMAMSGICVWHAGFGRRFAPNVACYQYVRNMMAMMALHGDFFDQRVFLFRFWRTCHYLMRTMDYDAASLWLDGMEDYLKGPEFLMQANGAQLMKDNAAKAEQLAPVEELDQAVMSGIEYDPKWLIEKDLVDRGTLLKAVSFSEKVLLSVPHDRHAFPDALLSSDPGVIAPGFASFTPWHKVAMRDTLVALNHDGTRGHIRTMDRERHAALEERLRSLLRRQIEEGDEIARHWREMKPVLSSRAFWMDYIERMS